MCTFCVPGAYEDQKGALNPLKPELQLVVMPYGCWERNPGPMDDKQVLLTAESSFPPPWAEVLP